jgi:hypothetical protein
VGTPVRHCCYHRGTTITAATLKKIKTAVQRTHPGPRLCEVQKAESTTCAPNYQIHTSFSHSRFNLQNMGCNNHAKVEHCDFERIHFSIQHPDVRLISQLADHPGNIPQPDFIPRRTQRARRSTIATIIAVRRLLPVHAKKFETAVQKMHPGPHLCEAQQRPTKHTSYAHHTKINRPECPMHFSPSSPLRPAEALSRSADSGAAVGNSPAFLVAGELSVERDGFKVKFLAGLPDQRPATAARYALACRSVWAVPRTSVPAGISNLPAR